MAATIKASLIVVGAIVLTLAFTSDRFPHVISEGGCGPRSLYALCHYLSMPITESRVLSLFRNNGHTSSFADINAVATLLQLKSSGIETTTDELKKFQPMGIVHVDGSHFVAILEYTSEGPIVADPIEVGITRKSIWSYSYLQTKWDGHMLVISQKQ